MLRRFWRDLVSALLSVGVHVLAGLLLLYGLPWSHSAPIEPVHVVEAVFLDVSREKLNEQRAVEAERVRQEAEEKRRADEARKAEEVRQRAAEEAQRKAAEEVKRKALEDQRRAEEELRKKQEIERARKKAEEEALRRAEEEKKRRAEELARKQAEEEARKKAEALRREAERRQRFADELAAEEAAMQRAQDDSDRAQYIRQIADHVRRRWVRPSGAADDFSCRLRITQLPGGQIANVELLESCGNPFLDASVENAVRKADPLPLPGNRRVFERTIIFTFQP